MNTKINAIVLAGTHGAKPFEIDGKEIRKQYIEIRGKTIIERIVDAVLEARLINKVYVVGNVDELKVCLGNKDGERCILVEQGDNMAINVVGTFARHIVCDIMTEYRDRCLPNELIDKYQQVLDEKVFIITSDVLFPSADSIDQMISQCDDDADVQYGLTDRKVLDEFIQRYGLKDYDENLFKTAFLPVGRLKLRINNMCVAKPLRIPASMRGVSESWYENRMFVDDSGRSQRSVWKSFASKIRKYVNESCGTSILQKLTVYRGLVNFMLMGLVLYLAKNCNRGSRLADLRDIERALAWLTGIKIRCCITDSLSVIDLDRPDLYIYLREKGIFDKIYSLSH